MAVCFSLRLVSFYFCPIEQRLPHFAVRQPRKRVDSAPKFCCISHCVHFSVLGLRLTCYHVNTAHAWLVSGLSVGLELWDLFCPYRLRNQGLHRDTHLLQLTQQVGIRSKARTQALWQVTESGCVSFFLSGPSSFKLARSLDLSALPPEPSLGSSSGMVFKP